ncbi:uncharacterized protein LOC131667989 [Phymastichus coffea]|uniref:uncharacterized protein LOC131667989 n=1 Tax=Phymastichus coffea TaxID=108790 RepID=UPI00273AF193|nr:uncharacterized protein LOC131667989 [Phymastichus coffea]
MQLRLSVLALSLCLCLALMVQTEAQLNFSTGWGKRNRAPQVANQETVVESQDRHPFRLQQPDLDLLLRYYRKLKQIEAQRRANSA